MCHNSRIGFLKIEKNYRYVWVYEREWTHRLKYLNASFQLVELFERVNRCGLVGGSMPLGMDFEVSKVCARFLLYHLFLSHACD